jgi:hypothetical protein
MGCALSKRRDDTLDLFRYAGHFTMVFCVSRNFYHYTDESGARYQAALYLSKLVRRYPGSSELAAVIFRAWNNREEAAANVAMHVFIQRMVDPSMTREARERYGFPEAPDTKYYYYRVVPETLV